MTQATPIIGANKSGIVYRQEDNDGKRALLNHHKGPTPPAYAEAGTIWLDDTATPWLLKFHDGADWIVLSAIHPASNAVQPYHGTATLPQLAFAADTGSVNAAAIAPVPAITAYAMGQVVQLRPAFNNTGNMTIAVNGLSAKSIKMPDGTNPPAGALLATAIHTLVYDGTHFVLLNPAPHADLAAVEALAGTGIATRTAANTWATRTINGTSGQIAVTQGDGVAGNPTIALDPVFMGGFGRLFEAVNTTISADTITISSTAMRVLVILDTEGAAALDQLSTINGGIVGQEIILRTSTSSRDVEVVDGSTSILLSGGTNFTLAGSANRLCLMCSGSGVFVEMSRASS